MRRLIAFCLLLPLIPLAVLWTLTGGSAMLTQLGVAGPILVVWTLVVIGIVLRFPRAVFEAAVYCLALVGVILLSPIADFLASQVKGTWGPQHSLGLGFLFLVAGVALVVGIEAALLWLVRAAPRTMRRRSPPWPSMRFGCLRTAYPRSVASGPQMRPGVSGSGWIFAHHQQRAPLRRPKHPGQGNLRQPIG
jgi:hypothetical protein